MAAVAAEGRALRAVPNGASAESALSNLYERYYARILAFCDRRAKTREDAEDAAQTTFLQAYRGLQLGTVPLAEEPWLFRIAQNVCVAHWRSTGRRRTFETAQDPGTLADLAAAPERADVDLDRLKRALARLPENQRRAILLREWQGFSYGEIATELGVGVPSVEALVFRARRGLALQLEPKRRRLEVGSFLAGLKTLLAGGAVKIATTGAALVATTVVANQITPRQHAHVAPKTPVVVPSESLSASAPAAPARSANTLLAPSTRSAQPHRRSATVASNRRLSGTGASAVFPMGEKVDPRATGKAGSTPEAASGREASVSPVPPAPTPAPLAPARSIIPAASATIPPVASVTSATVASVTSATVASVPSAPVASVTMAPVSVPTPPVSLPTAAPPPLPQTPDLAKLPKV